MSALRSIAVARSCLGYNSTAKQLFFEYERTISLLSTNSSIRHLSVSSSRSAAAATAAANKEDLVLVSTRNGVSTLTMNDPKKLNAWTQDMMLTLFGTMDRLAVDPATKVAILTGKDPYYCAGVNLNSLIKPMHPKKLHALIVSNNEKVFNKFIEFPKPLIIAANGPAIGACVTSATLCDAIIASEKATFSTPFAALGIPPEGCSSVHFERIMGKANAKKMLDEGWKPTAKEAKEAGFVSEVVPHEKLLERAQKVAEEWAASGKKRGMLDAPGRVDEYKAINKRESVQLADAFLAVPFLDGQYRFLKSKGKTSTANVFWMLKTFRPLWAWML